MTKYGSLLLWCEGRSETVFSVVKLRCLWLQPVIMEIFNLPRSKGAVVNIQNMHRWSPLHHAVFISLQVTNAYPNLTDNREKPGKEIQIYSRFLNACLKI